MNCAEASRLIGPWIDGELDVRSVVEIEGHLARCPGCAQEKKELVALGDTARERLPRFELPPDLEARLLGGAPVVPLASRRRRFLREASLMAAAACATLVVGSVLRPAGVGSDEEIVDAHVRSLQAQHLTDVASSDQHTVKPWFQGKIDFSVPAQDFAAQGFALTGGRLDVLDGRPVAALVYRRHQHLINLFVSPAAAGDGATRSSTARGYRVSTWTKDGLRYRLVSELPESEDAQLISLLRGGDSAR
jgi:anti-sigma factor RsiW